MVLTHAGKNIFYMTGDKEIIFEQEKLAKRQIRMTAGTSVGEDCSGGKHT